ncbi:Retrovirus-related Pol polyprotein from transposon 297,Retrovirus-related Pol polyprotein from transposon 17.6 [Mytilus coruscus]|uniref:Retrovirus-related Pol polyprotein from transposon 297,Retrovirus-related Pol polyprotein from transposon 17.6 n=1 Tax=Mytilus coruscus TaxID=42192 RepID=A0A6J8ABE1_MYTCO|nr:Retrovirus-related Pol polyprotein from transposon 297,Retrovirus-related Pol polyprotein from transposon 17.6 [Mytilus coruscus]
MEAMLRGLNWKSSLVYLDDVLVFCRTFQDHLLHLQHVFERLRNTGLKLHPSKCNFAKQKVRYIGHIVNSEGISPDPEKVTAIRTYPTPTNIKQLRAFLGLSKYYHRFMKNYSKIASPLHQLTRKFIKFIWTEQCQTAFDELKESLSQPQIL